METRLGSGPGPEDRWAKGEAYERYLGRWSAQLARLFVHWLADVSPSRRWLDVGCGTGALAGAVSSCSTRPPELTVGADPSVGFLGVARTVNDARPTLVVAPAEKLPFRSAAFDVVVSGLVLNFLVDAPRGVREMIRVCRPGGTVAAYVWDYTGEMWLLRHFWESVFELVPEARELEEVRRFATCRPKPLTELFTTTGLADIQVDALDSTAHFRDFDDYWEPFLAGQGAAPSFLVSLPPSTRTALEDRLRRRLRPRLDGSIALALRVWAIRGRVKGRTATPGPHGAENP